MKQNIRIGYLSIRTPVTNVYLGGLMVVDERGLPLEFRYTEPIQPTRIQRVLYGNALEKYLKTDVIQDTLIQSLEAKPKLVIVNDDMLLDESEQSGRDFEVIKLITTHSPPIGDPGEVERISAAEYLVQLTAESSPIRVQLFALPEEKAGGVKSLPDKSDSGGAAFRGTKAYTYLTAAGRTMDVTEPLLRVDNALEELCQEAGINSAVTSSTS